MALPLVFGSDILELAEFFDRCRVKRHAVTYESVTAISNAEADERCCRGRFVATTRVGAMARDRPRRTVADPIPDRRTSTIPQPRAQHRRSSHHLASAHR
jgi:hypothetical protein